MGISQRGFRGLIVATAAGVVGLGLVAPTGAIAAGGAGPGQGISNASAPGTHYAVMRSVCSDAQPGYASCDSIRRVPVAKGTPGAQPYTVSNSYPHGPAGGFTPADLATGYDFNPNSTVGATQTVGIVDAFNDPNARADLNHFDENYSLPDETATSLRIVGQTGSAVSLPSNDTTGWSIEESLDLDAVRGVCHLCKIILVETNSTSFSDLSAGDAAAVGLGATEVSNSYGGEENPSNTATENAAFEEEYNFPGVVITASTGDHGWYDFDYMNENYYDDGVPNVPASLPDVVSVGGTSLYLTSAGAHSNETVWNRNGSDDSAGWTNSHAEGASGGGCSQIYPAPGWQLHVPGFSSAGCGTNRLSADVAAIADPYTGYDIYDTFNGGEGVPDWATYGGTSLASPVTAAMWALAGGAGGVSYPAMSLYGHFVSAASPFFDVTTGGNSYCGGDDPASCAANGPLSAHPNPNAAGFRTIDCSFAPYPSTDATVLTDNSQCNAKTGFDGPSGVGTPEGLSGLGALHPTVHITRPALALHKSLTFASTSTDPYPGGSIISHQWNWGDGSPTSSGASAHHTYTKAGTYTVKLLVGETYGQTATTMTTFTIGKKPALKVKAPSSLKHGKKGKFSASATDSNTGGKIKYSWKWGDHTSSTTGRKVTHTFAKAGTYKVKLTATDSTGGRAKKKITVTVT